MAAADGTQPHRRGEKATGERGRRRGGGDAEKDGRVKHASEPMCGTAPASERMSEPRISALVSREPGQGAGSYVEYYDGSPTSCSSRTMRRS